MSANMLSFKVFILIYEVPQIVAAYVATPIEVTGLCQFKLGPLKTCKNL